jgi:putative phosphoesterase
MRIGLISDTHGLLRGEAQAALAGVDHILHAGDIGTPELLDALREVAPLTAVRGNTDHGAWAEAVPLRETVRFRNIPVHVVHSLDWLEPADAVAARVVVSGHTHKPLIETRGGVLYVNPGAAGPRRFSLPVTIGFLTIDANAAPDAVIQYLAV